MALKKLKSVDITMFKGNLVAYLLINLLFPLSLTALGAIRTVIRTEICIVTLRSTIQNFLVRKIYFY